MTIVAPARADRRGSSPAPAGEGARSSATRRVRAAVGATENVPPDAGARGTKREEGEENASRRRGDAAAAPPETRASADRAPLSVRRRPRASRDPSPRPRTPAFVPLSSKRAHPKSPIASPPRTRVANDQCANDAAPTKTPARVNSRAEDQRRRVEAACARAGVESPPGLVRDAEPESEPTASPSPFGAPSDARAPAATSPPLPASAAKHTPARDHSDVHPDDAQTTPLSGPRGADAAPQPVPRAPPSAMLRRAVDAAADAVAVAEAASDASFEAAEESLSPSPGGARRKTPAAESAAAARGFPVAASADAGASVASILGFLDEVERDAALAGADATLLRRSAPTFSVRASVAAIRAPLERADVDIPRPGTVSAAATPLRALKRLAALGAELDRSIEASAAVSSAATAFPCSNASESGSVSAAAPPPAGALAAATSVYEGVRARMESLRSDLARRDATVAKLEAELRVAYDRAAAQTAAQLAEQRAANDAATQRHLDLADRLLKDKEQLAEKCAELGEALARAEARRVAEAEALEANFAEAARRTKKKWDASREEWERAKAEELKELTIRGLEPEIQRLAQKHQQDVRELEERHRENLRRQSAEMESRHEAFVRGLRERHAEQLRAGEEEHRRGASARLREQAERHEEQLAALREKSAKEGGSLVERYEAGRRDERERYEATLRKLNEEQRRREDEAAAALTRAEETADARRKADLAATQARLDRESEAWRAKVTAKAQEALRKREREIIAKAEAKRDAEIAAIAERLRGEAAEAVASRAEARTRDAEARAERAERAASAAERAAVAAKDEAAAFERELAAEREMATREGVVGGAFRDRLDALANAAAAAETRAAAAEAARRDDAEKRDAETAAIEQRVRRAMQAKDDTIAALTRRLDEMRGLLEAEEEHAAARG